jgi:hypothetical protein
MRLKSTVEKSSELSQVLAMPTREATQVSLTDCGRASRATQGGLVGWVAEATAPPYNRIYF